MKLLAVAAAAALAASYLGVALVREAAHRWKWLDHPTHRGMHNQPTPRGGGLAIVVVSLAAIFWSGWTVVGLGGLAIAAVSWIDDLRSLPNSIRFAVHSAAALAAIYATGCIDRVGLPHELSLSLGVFGCFAAFIWIVGLTNGYNFMDGIDGMAGLQGVVAGTGFAMFGSLHGRPDIALVGAVAAAASLGFVFHNWSPARIFMGDVGAAFLGYLFAVMAMSEPGTWLATVLFVWPFVLDTSFTMFRRALNRENIFSAHRSHLYQRMVQAGYSHARVAALYGLLAAIGVWAGLALLG